MDTPQTPPSRRELAEKLSTELVQLRSALLKLSLCLKDWQFELDQNGNRQAEKMAQETLDRFKLSAPARGNASPNSHPSASES